MKIIPTGWVFLLLAAATHGQAPESKARPAKAERQQSEAENKIARAWLECEECREGELQAVRRLGPAAVALFAQTLQEGPPTERREEYRRHLTEAYAASQKYGEKIPAAKMPGSESEYVDFYMRNFIALYKMRSARVLGEIGGAAARAALEQSLRNEPGGPVHESIQQALAHLKK
jgi:hypothetical protein